MKEQEFMQAIIRDELPDIEQVRENCHKKSAAFTRSKPRPVRKMILIAAAAALTFTTALATGLPGWIRSLTVGGVTVNEYEPGTLPVSADEFSSETVVNGVAHANDYDVENFTRVTRVGGVANDIYEIVKLESLEESQAALGVPLLVPTYLENNEVPLIPRKLVGSFGVSAETLYAEGYFEDSGMLVTNGSAFFILVQTYVGDKEVTFDTVENIDEAYTTLTVNGYEMMWHDGPPGSRNNGWLQWVQDECLIQLGIVDMDKEYALKIAGSLARME